VARKHSLQLQYASTLPFPISPTGMAISNIQVKLAFFFDFVVQQWQEQFRQMRKPKAIG
jgi:hypothetical protein